MNFYSIKKNILRWLFFVGVLMHLSCKKDPIGFDMTYRNSINVNAGLNTIEIHNFVINNIPTDTAAFFKANNSGSSKILSILPKYFNIRENSGVDLSFISKVVVIISSKSNPSLPQTAIFYRDDIPFNNDNSLDLIGYNVDLRPYLFENKYDLKVQFWLRGVSQISISPELNWTFLAQTN